MTSRHEILLRRSAAVIVTIWLLGGGPVAWIAHEPKVLPAWYLLFPVGTACAAMFSLIVGTAVFCFFAWAFESKSKIREPYIKKLEKKTGIK